MHEDGRIGKKSVDMDGSHENSNFIRVLRDCSENGIGGKGGFDASGDGSSIPHGSFEENDISDRCGVKDIGVSDVGRHSVDDNGSGSDVEGAMLGNWLLLRRTAMPGDCFSAGRRLTRVFSLILTGAVSLTHTSAGPAATSTSWRDAHV